MVGFGSYHYKYESGGEGDSLVADAVPAELIRTGYVHMITVMHHV